MQQNAQISIQKCKQNIGDSGFDDSQKKLSSIAKDSQLDVLNNKEKQNEEYENQVISLNYNLQSIQNPKNTSPSEEYNQQKIKQDDQPQKEGFALDVQMPQVEVFQKVEVNLDEQRKNDHVNVEECYEKLKSMHMLKVSENNQQREYTTCESLCHTYVGFSCCYFISKRKSDLDQQGIAISIYFKQLKGLILLSFCFFLLSVPVTYLYVQTAVNSNMTKFNSYSSYLAYTFAGAWGYDVWQCQMGNYEELINKNENFLKCQTGFFDIQFSQIGLIQPSNSTNYYGCQFAQIENIITDCNKNTEKYLEQKCQNQKECLINYNDMIQEYFQNTDQCKSNLQSYQIFISLPCKNTFMDFGSFQISKMNLSIFIIIVDIVIFYAFLISVFAMKRTSNSIAHQITINNCMAENFTILVMNLPNLEQNLLTSTLWGHLQNYLDQQCTLKGQNEIKIIDIKLGYQYTQIKCQKRIAKLSKTLEKLIFKFVRKYDPSNDQLKSEQNVTINHLKNIYEAINNLEIKANANIDLQKIIKVKSNLQDFKMKDFEISLQKNKINFAWVTFETMDQKQRAFKLLNRSIIIIYFYKIYYFLFNFFKKSQLFNKDQIHFHQRVLQIEKTVTPDNINWKNLYYSNTNKFFRKIFSLIISITILILSFVAVGIIKSVQKFLTVQYPSVNCNTSQFQGINKEDVENIPQDTVQYQKMLIIECFCWLQNYQYKLQSSLHSICNDWYQNYISNLFLPLGIVISLIIVNFLIQKILTKLSKFEKYKFLNSQMNSQIDKIFIVSFINSVFIIYQTNQKQTPPQESDSDQQNFMQKVFGSGQFYSYNPEWYRNVGIIFTISLISKSLSIPLGKISFYYYKRFIFFIDQKCSFDKNKTKCQNNQQWLKLRQGPKFSIQYRYAQHLVVLFFMMTFGVGMPLIYLASTLYFVFTLYSDKFLIFKFCRKSRSFDGQMASHFQVALYFSFYLHLISSSNTFLNPQLFYDFYSAYYDKYVMNQVFQVNLENPYMLAIYSGCFMILVIYLARIALRVLNLYKLFCKKSNSRSEKKSIIKCNKFYEFMDKGQLQTEINLIDYSIIYNQPDQYLKQKLIQKKDILQDFLSNIEKFPPLMTFVGNYSYDYKLNTSFQHKLRWLNDLKMWRLEYSQSEIKLFNSYQKEQSSHYNKSTTPSIYQDQKRFVKKQQTISRWKNNEKKNQDCQDIIGFSSTLQTQYQSIKKNLKISKKENSLFRTTFLNTFHNVGKAESNNPISSKQEISFFLSNDNLNQDSNQMRQTNQNPKQDIIQLSLESMSKKEDSKLNTNMQKNEQQQQQQQQQQQILSNDNNLCQNELKTSQNQIFCEQKKDKEKSQCLSELIKPQNQTDFQDIESLDGQINLIPIQLRCQLKQ
ncbi:hypothetical protein ABPG74_015535 [Tetrahymena malaccensis]